MRFQETGVSLGELDRAVELEVLLFARRNRNRCMSSYLHLIFEVPQETILVPMLPLGHLLNSFKDILYLCYANDAQLYFSIQPANIAVESKSKHSYTVLYMFSCVFTPQPH